MEKLLLERYSQEKGIELKKFISYVFTIMPSAYLQVQVLHNMWKKHYRFTLRPKTIQHLECHLSPNTMYRSFLLKRAINSPLKGAPMNRITMTTHFGVVGQITVVPRTSVKPQSLRCWNGYSFWQINSPLENRLLLHLLFTRMSQAHHSGQARQPMKCLQLHAAFVHT